MNADSKARTALYRQQRDAAAQAREDEASRRRAESLRTLIIAHRNYDPVTSQYSFYADMVGPAMLGFWGRNQVYHVAANLVRDIVGESPHQYNIRDYYNAWQRIVLLQGMSRQS